MRVVKGLLWAFVACVVVVAGLFAWGRLRAPTAEQAKALALLQRDLRPAQGHNAYPWLWFAQYDVPPDQLDAAYASDQARVVGWVKAHREQVSQLAPEPSAGFPVLPTWSRADQEGLCSMRDAACLAKVRDHADAVRAVLAHHAVRVSREEALTGFDYVWDDMPATPMTPMAPFNLGLGVWQSAIALDAVDGRQVQALDRVCTQVTTMRRLHAHSNTLVSTLILAANMRSGVRLFSQVLAETPAATPLPSSCAAAFAPPAAEDVDLCPALQSEFAVLGGSPAFGRQTHWYDSPALSRSISQRMLAPGYAAACESATVSQLLDDKPVSLAGREPHWDLVDAVANSAGMVLSRIGLPPFDGYLARQQDEVSALRMGALLIWLRATPAPGVPLEQRLRQRPAWMRFGDDRHLRVAPDGHGLLLDMRFKQGSGGDTPWSLPAAS